MSEHYRALVEFHPRLEGSAGEVAALDYIDGVLADYDLSLSRREFTGLEDEHSFSRIARVNLPGVVPGRLFLLVPLNHARGAPAGADGSAGIAAALTLLEELAGARDRPSVSFVFLGAETEGRRLGTRLFLRDTASDARAAAVYLDLHAPGGTLTAEIGSGGRSAPRWLAEAGVRSLVTSGLPRRQHLSSLQIARSPLARATVLGSYLDAGMAAIRIHEIDTASGPPEVSLTPAWAGATVTFLRQLVRDAAVPSEASWDRNYIYAAIGSAAFFMGEQAYLLVLLAVLVSPLIYGIAFRRRLARYAGLVARHVWALVALAGLMFFFFFVSTAVIRGIMDFRNFPTLWQYAPGPYFVLKLVISVFLFALVFQSVRGLPFPRNGSFYSASAIFLLFFDIVLLAAFDIAFTFYFLWGFLFAFFFSLARRTLLKILMLLAAPLWLVVAGAELFAGGELEAAGALLLSPVSGNLIFAFIMLPFLLMLIRVDLMVHRRLRFPHGSTLRVTILASAAVAVLFSAALVFLDPFSPENPQPVDVVEVIDARAGNHRIEVSSPAPLDGLRLSRGAGRYLVEGEVRTHSFELSGRPQPVSLELEEQDFLSRSRKNLLIRSDLDPGRVSLRLSSPQELLIFDARYPFETDTEGREVRFAIGPFPPNPLEVSFTVPRDVATRIDLELFSEQTSVPITGTGARYVLSTGTRVIQSLEP